MTASTGMQIDLRPGETLRLTATDGQQIAVTLVEKSGQRARIAVQAPKEVKITRPPGRQ